MAIERFKNIVPDPCNRAAERRNFQAIKDSFEEVVDEFDGFTGNGNVIVPFKCSATNVGGSSVAVLAADRGASPWVFDQPFTAYDYSGNGRFGPNMVAGHHGFGRIAPEIGPDSLEIIELDGFARIIDGTLASAMSGGTASANVANFYGAYPNAVDPGSPVAVYDRLGLMVGASAGQKYIAVWDEQSQQYVVVAPSLAVTSSGKGTVDCVRVNGTGNEPVIPGVCVFDGFTQDVDPSKTCANFWLDDTSIWILDGSGASILNSQERFIAVNTGISFDVSGDVRTLYVIKSAGNGGGGTTPGGFYADSTLIEIIGGSVECEEVEATGNCLFQARLITFSPSGSVSACDSFSTGSLVYATAINGCSCGGLMPKHGDRFIAIRFSEEFGPTLDKRELYAFRISDPVETAVVEVFGSPGDDQCDLVDETSCLYPGKILKRDFASNDWCGGGVAEGDDCWIWVLNQCDTIDGLPNGDRYVGVCLGESTGRPVYAVRAKGSQEKVRWGRVLGSWRKGSSCDEVTVNPATDCSGNEVSSEQIVVLCPKTSYGDTNLTAGDVIGYLETSDNEHVICTDYMDDKIGTVKMHTNSGIPNGWAICNGNQASGVDLIDRFPRGTNLGSVGLQGGREQLEKEELSHHHKMSVSDTAALRFFWDGSGNRLLMENGACMEDVDPYESYLFDDQTQLWTPAPKCDGDWGPFNIMNPYTTIVFIERIDNSA